MDKYLVPIVYGPKNEIAGYIFVDVRELSTLHGARMYLGLKVAIMDSNVGLKQIQAHAITLGQQCANGRTERWIGAFVTLNQTYARAFLDAFPSIEQGPGKHLLYDAWEWCGEFVGEGLRC